MADRELLEKAAKAFWGEEIDDVCSVRWLEEDQSIGYTHGDNQDHNGQDREFVWNPLTDDGDALRLAVKLGFRVDIGQNVVYVGLSGEDEPDIAAEPWHKNGPACDKATRRAITLAAAMAA